MFKMFKKIFIYLLLLPRTFTFPVDGNDVTLTPNVEAALEEELLRYAKYLDKIPNDVDRAEFKVELKAIVRRALQERLKADELLTVKGRLENENNNFRRMLCMLGARSRVERLVDDLYPGKRPFNVGVAKAYEEILTSTKPEFQNRSCIKIFRQRVISYGVSNTDFVDAIRSIYGSLSDNVAHKMSAFDPLPPNFNDIKGIEQMFKDYGITPDEAKVKTVQIILQPMPLPSTTSSTTTI